MQQILCALWNSNTEEDFLLILRDWIYIENKTLDPYVVILTNLYNKKFPEAYNIPKAAVDMLEKSKKFATYVG